MRHGEAGEAGCQALTQGGFHPPAVEIKHLEQLEHEQGERQQCKQYIRGCNQIRPEQHAHRPGYRSHIKEQIEAIGEPGQPAGDKMVALAPGQAAGLQPKQQRQVLPEDKNRPIGPAETLFLEVRKIVRHQPLAIAFGDVGCLVSLLENTQTQLGVLGDAPFAPSAHFFQHPSPYQCHGTVLDDCIALVAGHHAYMEKAAVLSHTHRFKRILRAVPIILRSLDNAHFGILEVGHHIPQPVGFYGVVAVDHRDNLSRRIGLLQSEVQCSGLEAGKRINVKEAEACTQALAVDLNRLPDGGIFGVVVDNQHLKLRIIERRQRIKCFNHHIRRFVIGGNVHRDHGKLFIRHSCGAQLRSPGAHPGGLRQLMSLSQQDDDNTKRCNEQHDPYSQCGWSQVLMGVFPNHPHSESGNGVGHQRKESAAAGHKPTAVAEHNRQQQYRESDADRHQSVPPRDSDNRRGKRKFGLPVDVIHPPVGSCLSLQFSFPELVECLHQIIGVAFTFRDCEKTAQEFGLIGQSCLGVLAGTAIAGPADFGDYDALLRIGSLQLFIAENNVIHSLLHIYAFPVRQNMDGDKIDLLDQFRIFKPDVPGFRQTDWSPDILADPFEVADHLLDRLVATQQGLIADNHPNHLLMIFPIDTDKFLDLFFVSLLIPVNPAAEHYIELMCAGQWSHFGQRRLHRVGTHGIGFTGEQGEILIDLRNRGEMPGHGSLRAPHRGETETLDRGWPGRLHIGLVDNRPQQKCQAAH